MDRLACSLFIGEVVSKPWRINPPNSFKTFFVLLGLETQFFLFSFFVCWWSKPRLGRIGPKDLENRVLSSLEDCRWLSPKHTSNVFKFAWTWVYLFTLFSKTEGGNWYSMQYPMLSTGNECTRLLATFHAVKDLTANILKWFLFVLNYFKSAGFRCLKPSVLSLATRNVIQCKPLRTLLLSPRDVCICVCVCVRGWACSCVCVYVHTRVWLVCIRASMCYRYVCVCMYVRACVCVCVCVCVRSEEHTSELQSR